MASLEIWTVWLVVHKLDQHVHVWNLTPELENLIQLLAFHCMHVVLMHVVLDPWSRTTTQGNLLYTDIQMQCIACIACSDTPIHWEVNLAAR